MAAATPIIPHSLSMYSAITDDVASLSSNIRSVTAKFQHGDGNVIPGTNARVLKENGIYFFGIHRNEQMIKHQDGSDDIEETAATYSRLKSYILTTYMHVSPESPVIQVVGDSAAYSRKGTAEAQRFLSENLPHEAIVLYGYTGHAEADGTRCVNASVTDFITEHKRTDQTIGNLVAFHTPIALSEWGCSGPLLKYQILVYGDDESSRSKGTVFGDDITTSDFMANSLLSLVGGIQSFHQICNFLRLNKPITAIDGLRGERTLVGTDSKGITKPYFSACEFLQFIKESIAIHSADAITNNFLDTLYESYFATHFVSDPKRGDYDTKEKLLLDAWLIFKSDELYKKLDLFHIST